MDEFKPDKHQINETLRLFSDFCLGDVYFQRTFNSEEDFYKWRLKKIMSVFDKTNKGE